MPGWGLMKSNEQEKKKVPAPRLRFKQFKGMGEWGLVKLKDISIPVTEKVGKRKLTPVSISAGVGFVPQAEKFGRDISGNQYELYTVVRDGEFVFNKGNSKTYPEGAVYLLEGWGEVSAPNVFISFKLKKGYKNDFFKYLFEKNAHGRELRPHITSGARSNGLLNISKETFFNINLPVTSEDEQTHIATCLSSLDAVITAHTDKLNALRQHKRALMQQLFPQVGERVPRLRFPEFEGSGEWEVSTVGEMSTSFSGGTPSTSVSAYYGGKIPFVRSAEINSDKTEIYLTEEGFKNSSAKVVIKGDLLMALYGANSGDVGLSRLDGVINQAILCIRPDCETKFLYYFLEANKERIINLYVQGGQGNLSAEIVKTVKFSYPKSQEQQRIAACLSSLDDLIDAQADKVAGLREFKRGLMQGLFPRGGEA